MLDQVIAKSETSQLKASPDEKKFTYEVIDARPSIGDSGPKPQTQSWSWSFGSIPLMPSVRDGATGCVAANEEKEKSAAAHQDGHGDVSGGAGGGGGGAAADKTSHDRASCSDKTCSVCAGEHDAEKARAKANDVAPVAQNKCSAKNGEEACNCKKCSGASDRAGDDPPAPARAAQDNPTYTYTFLDRQSYGATSGGFVAPRCAPGGRGSAVLQAGYANPVVNVYPNGTYTVRRSDGVQQTATCRRLAAGLAATRTHENSHAAGARRAAAAGNTAAGLPRNFATEAECSAAAPGLIATYQAAVDPIWDNEITHGPGTLPPTAQTFTEENAAGTCTFA